MQMQYNTYTAMNTQLEAARAKLRQYTPVFTMVKGADVPIKATSPKRMIFVAFCVFPDLLHYCILQRQGPALQKQAIKDEDRKRIYGSQQANHPQHIRTIYQGNSDNDLVTIFHAYCTGGYRCLRLRHLLRRRRRHRHAWLHHQRLGHHDPALCLLLLWSPPHQPGEALLHQQLVSPHHPRSSHRLGPPCHQRTVDERFSQDRPRPPRCGEVCL